MDALVNTLNSSSMTVGAATDPALPAAAPKPETLYEGERMKTLGLSPVKESELENEIIAIYSTNETPYARDEDLLKDVGKRLVAEIETLSRLINPNGTYTPDWYDEDDEDETPLSSLLNRSEFEHDYPEHLAQTYLVPDDIAEGIYTVMSEYLAGYEAEISNYYYPPK